MDSLKRFKCAKNPTSLPFSWRGLALIPFFLVPTSDWVLSTVDTFPCSSTATWSVYSENVKITKNYCAFHLKTTKLWDFCGLLWTIVFIFIMLMHAAQVYNKGCISILQNKPYTDAKVQTDIYVPCLLLSTWEHTVAPDCPHNQEIKTLLD